MCPSFRATGEEKDVTRGRANILRELLTRPKSKKVFNQKEILEALDLCLSCKACKSECPSNVDMSRYKADFCNIILILIFLPLEQLWLQIWLLLRDLARFSQNFTIFLQLIILLLLLLKK